MNTTRGELLWASWFVYLAVDMNRYSIFFPWFSKVFLCVEPGTSQRCLALEVWQLAIVPIYLVAMLGVEYLGADVGICWVILRFVNPAWDFSRWWMGSNCLNDSWIVDWFILVHANVGELCRNCFVGNSVFEIFIYSPDFIKSILWLCFDIWLLFLLDCDVKNVTVIHPAAVIHPSFITKAFKHKNMFHVSGWMVTRMSFLLWIVSRTL
jgi:hypothetical protein